MIYLKSFLAGLTALIGLCGLIIGAAFLAPVVMERLPLPGGGIDFVVFPKWTVAAAVALIVLVSAAVSCWTFKRAQRTSRLRS
jgi:hypothetical protein